MSSTSSAKITMSAVKRMMPGDKIWDPEIRGFGVRCQGKSVSYMLKTRVKGRQKWVTIGRHGSPWTPETARREAIRLLADVANGIDPTSRKQAEAAQPIVADASQRFMADHGAKLKATTREEYERLFRTKINPALGKQRVADIERGDIARLHTAMSDTPRHANHMLSVMSKFMNWCEEAGLRRELSNPCRTIKKYKERKRERYLTADELARLGAVLDQVEQERSESEFVVAAIRLLILTGARLSEILTLRWKYVDFARGILDLPDSKTGQKVIRLNDAAVAELHRIPRVAKNPHVIVGNRTGAHLVNLQRPWRRIRAMAELDDVRIHDLRHSFASFAVNAGASLPMIGGLLGHAQAQTTARYAHLADDPLRSVNDQVGQAISDAMTKDRKHTME